MDLDLKLRRIAEALLTQGEELRGVCVATQVGTTDGEKLKLTMMRGTGVFEKLGGGETQRHGLEAVAAWFTQHAR